MTDQSQQAMRQPGQREPGRNGTPDIANDLPGAPGGGSNLGNRVTILLVLVIIGIAGSCEISVSRLTVILPHSGCFGGTGARLRRLSIGAMVPETAPDRFPAIATIM